MKLLLDTHVLLAAMNGRLERRYRQIAKALGEPENTAVASVASIWEIAIKTRLGKLDPGMPLDMIAAFCEHANLPVIAIEARHAVASFALEPATRDPFDRLLLAQCAAETLLLATVDHALHGHPLVLPLS
ncbi:MAG: type II toxin-antitoxin system VapC family toxin [Alphaproteobacteria bacterium]|nr:type II toxin-antitoxin system VapC family toxin [Alphaproteobacteria bacterium]